MELILLAQFIKRWWYVVAIPLVLAVLWSLPAVPDALFPPATYGASMRFVAAAPPDAVQAIAAEEDALPRSGSYEDTAYVPWLASEYVVVNLPSWVTSERFAAEVSAVLADAGHDIPADEVRRALTADSARSIMTVYFGWDDEAELAAIIAAGMMKPNSPRLSPPRWKSSKPATKPISPNLPSNPPKLSPWITAPSTKPSRLFQPVLRPSSALP